MFKKKHCGSPTLPLFSRDTTASNCRRWIRNSCTGTQVLIAPLGTHHLARAVARFSAFAGPLLPEQGKPATSLRFIPFSAGPRVCIGNHFAMMEAQLVLTTLLRNYEFSLPEGTVVVPEIDSALRPKEGLHMRIKGERRVLQTDHLATTNTPTTKGKSR